MPLTSDLLVKQKKKYSFNELFFNLKRVLLNCFTKSIRSGSTACVAILSTNPGKENAMAALDVAWCGDSRLGIVKSGQLTFLTSEHKPDDEAERSRITNAGGNVSFVSNAWRIDSSLAVSRSFGKGNLN